MEKNSTEILNLCIPMQLQVVSQGAISAPMYSLKGPSMIQSLYPTAFPLKHQQKVCQVAFIALHTIEPLESLTLTYKVMTGGRT